MTITRNSAADRTTLGNRHPHAGGWIDRGLELYLLLATSAVVAAGLILVFQAKSNEPAYMQQVASSSQPLDLNQVRSAVQILPVLGFLENPEERAFAADLIYEYLENYRIQSVVQLRQIRVTRDQLARGRALTRFASALQDAEKRAAPGSIISIPLLTGAEVREMKASVVVRSRAQFSRSLILSALAFFISFFVVHMAWRRLAFRGDRILLPLIHLLSGIGFIFMVRLRDPLHEALLYPDFAVGVTIGCCVLLACSLLDYERIPLRRLAYVPLLGSFLLSILLLTFGSGPGASDAKVNLRIGSVSMQPVELIKVLLILFLAGYFARRWEFFRELKVPSRSLPWLLRGLNLPRLHHAVPVALAVSLAIIFFFLQKDLGPAMALTMVFLTLYAVARSRAVGALLGCAALVAAFWIGYQLNLPRTVSARVNMWLSPWDNYVRPGGDHLAHSLWTFTSGGVFGTGLGLGRPETLPAVHTDLILAAVGEELGFIGLAGIYILYALLLRRALETSLSASGHYSFFLGLGFTLLLGFQITLISGGILGLIPLSGVVTPFLNYGKSSAVVNFAIIGTLSAISARSAPPDRNGAFRRPLAWVFGIYGFMGGAILIQAARLQVFRSDEIMARGALVVQGDGHRRYGYNPRLMAAADSIPRGTIFDRNGIPLATNSQGQLDAHRAEYQRVGVPVNLAITAEKKRQYPFGALTYHFLGDWRTRINWGAPNTSFVERDLNSTLQGFDDHVTVVGVKDQPEGPSHPTLRRELQELIPLVRYRYRSGHEEVQRILRRNRDIRTTLDIRLQKALAQIVEQHIEAAKQQKGAAIVIDPANGNLLASVSYPWTGAADAASLLAIGGESSDLSGFQESLLDRPRYGLYPPGSSFKLVTAAAALQAREDVEGATFECKRLPDGRVGNFVRGWGRPIRDDILDTAPHGTVNMAKGLIQSCNAYFAQLGTQVVGAERLLREADLFGIRVASPNTIAQLRDALPQASYGQGQVVVTPLQMARVTAAICSGGISYPVQWISAGSAPAGKQVIPREDARLLAQYMRNVVTEGTGRSAGSSSVPVAGKTGTAELRDRPSHAWFVGFAPYSRTAARKIAFAVIVENGRYGGRVAAPLAADIVAAAARLGLIDRE